MLRRRDTVTPLTVLLALVLALIALGGCQTVAGLGRDLEAVASWSEERLKHGFAGE